MMIKSLVLPCFLILTAQINKNEDIRMFVEAVEALQQPIQDFRCEFEGTIKYAGKTAKKEKSKIDENGVYDYFCGVFIWRSGGDTFCDTIDRFSGENGQIVRDTLAVRTKDRVGELYVRANDKAIGKGIIKDISQINSWRSNSFGYIFLLDKLKRDINKMKGILKDDPENQGDVKIVELSLPLVEDPSPLIRYWIDLKKNCHITRMETYTKRNILTSRLDVQLMAHSVNGKQCWFPQSGERVSFQLYDNASRAVQNESEPQVIEKMYILQGTLQFNINPPNWAFNIKYKPRTPVSDHLQKLTKYYAQSELTARPSNKEIEKMLKEQVQKAEEQKKELIVPAEVDDYSWVAWTIGGSSCMLLSAAIVLFRSQRR